MSESPFTEYRLDGWPLCPKCGEDELMSFLFPKLNFTHARDTYTINFVINTLDGSIQDFIDAGMRCIACGWELPTKA